MAVQLYCAFRIFAIECEVRLFKRNSRFLCNLWEYRYNLYICRKLDSLGYIFVAHDVYGTHLGHCNLTGPTATDSVKQRKITAITQFKPSRLFKVTHIGTNGKPVCDFLCVNNSNLPHLSCAVSEMADYQSNFRCRHSNTLVGVEPLNSGSGN